ncbi:MAG TPA: tail fiber domain-containing protein [Candidatus Udaeobacter sp.]|jgi:trimeric autotransporter adhesin|nr:tail fiber domain-containing protein [Candidatus Udaeobacter sp.]
MKTFNQTQQTRKLSGFVIATLLAWVGLLPNTKAVSPAPDGGYPGGNTAEGQNALLSLTAGTYNTAVGLFSLLSNQEGQFNTGVGAGTLLANTAHQNTAIGAGALLSNTAGVKNTANGAFALFGNTAGNSNTASGVGALFNNITGFNNTAIGYNALLSNTTAGDNTAIGTTALFSNTTGEFNIAIGSQALRDNVTGDSNTAIGDSAGFNITGSGNVCIGAGVNGFAGESNITRIRNVYESVATERAVYVTSDNRIGTLASSRRYKEQIKPIEKASETIRSLRPVSFRYKKEIDPAQPLCFGLIAEEVADVNPNLVTLDCEGKPETVRYEAINAMLLSEFLKQHKAFAEEHHKVEKLEATVSRQQKQIEALAADLETVSSRLELSKAESRTIAKN